MRTQLTMLLGLVVLLTACGATSTESAATSALAGAGVTAVPVSASSMVPGAPAPGSYRMQVIDVGTGLSVLVQGADFTLLYDAGSIDDAKHVGTSSAGNQNRLLAYLYAAVGPSGGPECVPQGDAWTYNPAQAPGPSITWCSPTHTKTTSR